MASFSYKRGAEYPYLTLTWEGETASGVYAGIDMSTDYTFSMTLTEVSSTTATLTSTTNMVGLSTGVRIEWAAGDLDIAPGIYVLALRATIGGLDRDYRPGNPLTIEIK